MLTTRFGPEPKNLYSEGGLNRLSFVREDYDVILKAIRHESARFLLFGEGQKVFVKAEDRGLEWGVKLQDLESVLGVEMAYGKEEKLVIADWNSKQQKLGIGRVLSVFMGIDEAAGDAGVQATPSLKGAPVFAVDLALKNVSGPLKDRIAKVVELIETRTGGKWVDGRSAKLANDAEYGIFAHGKIYVDWNDRNRFCAGCGRPLMSVNGGCKLLCPATDAGEQLEECPSRGVITNISFPRTDSVVIMAILDYAGTKVLLGSGKRFPQGLFSCLAGFVEPGESIEECVRREAWEESGVKVGRVLIHSSQPWPYPANIMLGCIGQIADESAESHEIHLGHDPELREAKWFPVDELQPYLDRAKQAKSLALKVVDGVDMFIPPPGAVAHVLLQAAVHLVQTNKNWKI